MTALETLASLPQVQSLRIARDIIAELEGRGWRVVATQKAFEFVEPPKPSDHWLAESEFFCPLDHLDV